MFRSRKSRLLLGAVALVVVAGMLGALVQWRRWSRRPNVLLISLDTTRVDHLSCYGYSRPTSPNIDAVAEAGLRFRRSMAVSNWTLPSHASMLTGLYPQSHGAHYIFTPNAPHKGRQNPTGLMSESCESLAEILKAAGYRTGGVVANSWFLSPLYLINQGFEHYDSRVGGPPTLYRRAGQITDSATQWLGQDRGRPFFLFLNYMDPHIPYHPPPPYDKRFVSAQAPARPDLPTDWGGFRAMLDAVVDYQRPLKPEIQEYCIARYDGAIAYTDEQIGRLLAWLREQDWYDRTLIVITSDHGEGFGEHNLAGHCLQLYEPEVAVPMIVKLPYGGQRGVLDYGVQHVDILPTVLEVLGLRVPEGVQGRSMLRPSQRDLFADHYVGRTCAERWPRFNRLQRAICRGNLKYIEYSDGQQELFDLASDPGEQTNLVAQRPEVAELQAALAAWWDKTSLARRPQPQTIAPPSKEQLEALKDLGYLQ